MVPELRVTKRAVAEPSLNHKARCEEEREGHSSFERESALLLPEVNTGYIDPVNSGYRGEIR